MRAEVHESEESGESSCEEEVHSASMAVKVGSRKIPDEVLEAQHVIVSCGGNNFEITEYANGSTCKFRDYVGITDEKNKRGKFTKIY